MALGIGAPGHSPEMHAGEVQFRTLEEYRDQMRLITRQGLVDIMLMSASSNHALTIRERLFDDSPVTPAVRANDTTDIHLARGSTYRAASRRVRSARRASTTSSAATSIARPRSGRSGANLGLYSVTFNNDLEHDLRDAGAVPRVPRRGRAQGFPLLPRGLRPERHGRGRRRGLAAVHQRHDHADAGGGRPGGPAAVPQDRLSRPEGAGRAGPVTTRSLVVGILGGSAGTTRDAFQLLHDAQKYGAKVALFGRKINNAENQLAFVQFLRLIVEGQVGPVDAVKAYHAVLGQAGTAPASQAGRRPPADRPGDELRGDLEAVLGHPDRCGTSKTEAQPASDGIAAFRSAAVPETSQACACHSKPAAKHETAEKCGCSKWSSARHGVVLGLAVQSLDFERQRPTPIQRPAGLRPNESGGAPGLSPRAARAGAMTSKLPAEYPALFRPAIRKAVAARGSASDRMHHPLGLDEPSGINLVPLPLRGDAVADRGGDGASRHRPAARRGCRSLRGRTGSCGACRRK